MWNEDCGVSKAFVLLLCEVTVDSCCVQSLKESFGRELAASMILSSPSVRTAVPLFTALSTPASLPRSGRKIRMQCWEVASRSETSFTVRHLESLFAHFQCLGSQHPVRKKPSDSQIHNFLGSFSSHILPSGCVGYLFCKTKAILPAANRSFAKLSLVPPASPWGWAEIFVHPWRIDRLTMVDMRCFAFDSCLFEILFVLLAKDLLTFMYLYCL